MNKQSKKVLLVGHFNVGKTSLIKKFVKNSFSEDYITTIGVTIEKKEIIIKGEHMTFIIWDIAGEVTIKKTPKSYLLGLHGLIYVFDLARESTWQNMQEQVDDIKEMFPVAPFKIIGNKKDLLKPKEVEKILELLPVKCDFTSSAKTGENVERIFEELGLAML
ncbi:MAG: GTP-binding protein [Flavobacteriales bacterium]|nr:GTP-binding protein [Flavobacteriales bacterium]